MNHKAVIVPEGAFRSKLLPIAAVLLAVAAVTGLVSILCALMPGGLWVLDTTVIEESTRGWAFLHSITVVEDVAQTWTVIHLVCILFAAVCSSFLTIGLLLAWWGNLDRGMEVVARGARILFHATTVVGIGAAVVFVLRAVPYTLLYLSYGAGASVLLLVPGLLAEIVLALIAGLIIFKLRQFLDCAADCALSISGTLTSGILKSPSIPMTPSVGCLLLGIAGLLLALDRVSAASAWIDIGYPAAFLQILYFSAAMFLLSGAAAIMLSVYLRTFKNNSEYLLYKGIPVAEEIGNSAN